MLSARSLPAAWRLALLAALCAAAAPACFVFDARLYQERQDGGGTDAQPMDDVPADGPRALTLAENCTGSVPVVASSTTPFVVSTVDLHDDVSQVSACTGNDTLGNDGFFALDMAAGERWHVHVKPTNGTMANTAVYLLPACDDRSCQPGMGEDECGPGRDEHLTVVPTTGGRFFVAIDSRDTGGGTFEVTALRPTCGNRTLEHSESCDDGNTMDGDGCDAHCRKELSGITPTEVEPNDDALGANVLVLASGMLTFRGRLGGRCDFDTYSFAVPANGMVTASIVDPSGAACPTDTPPLRAALLLADGRTEVARAVGTASAPCPTLTNATPLVAGTYFVRLTTVAAEAPGYNYQVALGVTP